MATKKDETPEVEAEVETPEVEAEVEAPEVETEEEPKIENPEPELSSLNKTMLGASVSYRSRSRAFPN